MPAVSRVIIITGASAGIGAATALALAKAWGPAAKLILGARRKDRLEAVAEQCRTAGAEALAVVCDVSKRSDIDTLIMAALASFNRLDVMIANAGYGFLAKIHETTEVQFNEIVATNVKGTWYAMQAAAEVMLKQLPIDTGAGPNSSRGHIIAVSSGAARRGLPLYGVYSMTKAAQLSLTEAMRVELKSAGIYVSSVHPLTTATEFFDVASSKSRLRSTGMGHAQPAEVVGRKIVRLIQRPRPELWPVFGSRYMLAFATVFPRIADWAMAKTVGNRTR